MKHIIKKHRRTVGALALTLALLVGLIACKGEAKDKTITVYDWQYSEMHIVHRMVKLLVEDRTDLTVDIKDEMSPINAFNEVVKGNADLMNCYDGSLLTTFLHLDPEDVPEGQSLYSFANERASDELDVHMLGKLGINNTYTIGVPQALADEYELETIQDLVPIADQLVFGAEHDFFTEEGSAKYNPFIEHYDLDFKEARQIDIALKYSAVESGNLDVTVVYATDGLNRKAGLKILEDDLQFFPEYNGGILVRNDLFERMADTAPELESVLAELDDVFTNEVMVDLTYAVDVEGETAEAVAESYLREIGLLS